MPRSRSDHRHLRRHRRAGFSYLGLTVAFGALLVAALVGWVVWPEELSFSASGGSDTITHVVAIDEFVHDVTERGNIESASNTEIASRVKSGKSGKSGTTILEVVDEGTMIKPEDCLPEGYVVTHEDIVRLQEYLEAQAADAKELDTETTGSPSDAVSSGSDSAARTFALARAESEPAEIKAKADADKPPPIPPEKLAKCTVVVRLDSSLLENDLIQQQIVCENSAAAVIQAKNDLETAKISKQEYIEGNYEEQHLGLQINIKEAEVAWRQAGKYLEYSEKLYRKGYVTKQQRKDSETDFEKAANALKLAKKKLEVLEEYTRKKEIGQLEARIKTAEAKLRAEEASHLLDVEKLEFTQEQIAHCTIFAPESGQVVYANVYGHRGSGEIVIEPGTSIRENQTIIRLPDRRRMQVKAKINESRIALIESGMSATIRLDAFPDLELKGEVQEISAYPAPASWFRSSIKEYETIIRIDDPPPDLRPGLTAQVKIRVKQLDKAMQVPVQAIIEHGDKYYCVMHNENGKDFEKREVTIGPTNDKFVVIETGLDVGQRVVLNAGAYREEIGLPKLPPEAKKQRRSSPDGSDQRLATDGKGGQGGPAASGRPSLAEAFKRMDKNGNGKIEKSELPPPFQKGFSAADANADGALDQTEMRAAMAKMRQGATAGSGGGSPGGGGS